jgi:2-amino-4-hydroxy-6-hydroxymethyldihydropteridine diphosphokinase
MSVLAYIAIGSNLLNPLDQVITAFDEIGRMPRSVLIKKSSCYSSLPSGYKDQPDYINAVVLIETELSPYELLSELQTIEHLHKRERSFPNAPRTLDLDILLFGDIRLNSPELTIPHPRMHERAFVIFPLQEIDGNISIPLIGDIAKIAKELDPKIVKRITL